jgi:hypothetical protein
MDDPLPVRKGVRHRTQDAHGIGDRRNCSMSSTAGRTTNQRQKANYRDVSLNELRVSV